MACPKKVNLRNHEDSTKFGLWLKAPSPPCQQEMRLGRGGMKKSSSSQEKESYAEPSMSNARGNGLNQGVGRGPTAGIPNPKRLKFQKETSEDLGMNKGGKGSFLFKTQIDKAGFQIGKCAEREVYQDQRDGRNSNKDSQMKLREDSSQASNPGNSLTMFNLNKERADMARGKERGNCTNMREGGGSNGLFTSPSQRKESGNFTGLILADVEKTMLAATGITKEKMEIAAGICGGIITKWKRKSSDEQEISGEISSPPIHGGWKRKKRFLTRGDQIGRALHLIHYVTTKMDWGWRRLVSSPTDRNDNHKLKLPRAWKSSDSEQPWQNGEGKETHDGFHYGNQTTEKENGASSL
jgi:hypothetical protein